MIDIQIHPSQLAEAKRDIKDIIRSYNRYSRWDVIELRDSDGRFMPERDWMQVVDNTEFEGGEYFIRVEFDDDHKIQADVTDHFGEFNVGCC